MYGKGIDVEGLYSALAYFVCHHVMVLIYEVGGGNDMQLEAWRFLF